MPQTELTAVIDRKRLQTLFAELQRLGDDGKAITRIVAASLLYWGDSWGRIGANAPQAAIHQWGGKPGMRPGPAAIPARPFMGLDPTGERNIFNALAQRLSKALHP